MRVGWTAPKGENAMTIRPLEGMRVLDFTRMPPGGYCTVLLADLGAEVIRVESPGQAGKPSMVIGQVGLSRGKRSITLDTRDARGAEVLARLIATVDVVVENGTPGTPVASGFGYSQASALRPELIWCAITGYGQTGPYARWSGHDLSFLAQSGLLAALGGEMPWHPGAMLAVPTGALMAVTAIQSALLQRYRSGTGAYLDVSLAEAALWHLSGFDGTFTGEFDGIPATPDRRLYACADGRYIAVAAAEPRTWGQLCAALEHPELAPLLHQADHAEAVTQLLADCFAARPLAEWMAALGDLGAAVAPVNRGADIQRDPQFVARGAMVEVAGRVLPASPIRLSTPGGETSDTNRTPPGVVGADTDAVLQGAGFAADEIAAMRDSGLV